jgi:tripartite-type tricarboxylate transporter receptor subunit TctC
MPRYSSRYSLLLKTAGLLLALTTLAAAQEYPTKPVRLIIPFAPGGLNDTGGRVIATQLSARLGKQVVVENRTGAGGVVGTELVAHAPKVSTGHGISPVLGAQNSPLWRGW